MTAAGAAAASGGGGAPPVTCVPANCTHNAVGFTPVTARVDLTTADPAATWSFALVSGTAPVTGATSGTATFVSLTRSGGVGTTSCVMNVTCTVNAVSTVKQVTLSAQVIV